MLNTIQEYEIYWQELKKKPVKEFLNFAKTDVLHDIYFLLRFICNREDVYNQWILERCIEVQHSPNGYLDLWARDHYKSSIITFAKTIQDILLNPNQTISIASHTNPIAKKFLKQIKREFEESEWLQLLFPEILYKEPKRDSPKWSEDEGLIVKRLQNPKECTLFAFGLVDGQPTSEHYDIMIYDDVVTVDSVTTPEMMKKTVNRWEMSQNLLSRDGIVRYIGTRYHFNDCYKTMIQRGVVKERIYAATDDGTPQGTPVLLTKKLLDKKYRNMGSYTFATQMLLNPKADDVQSFKKEWLQYHTIEDLKKAVRGWNLYVIVDPASKKKATSDYTVIMCIGLAPDNNYYLIDAIRDRLNLTERTQAVFDFVRKWQPICVGYEEYGLQADIEHIEYVMNEKNYRFNIVRLGGKLGKNDRIRKLVPIFEHFRFWLPFNLTKVDYQKKNYNFTYDFVEDEYLAFPFSGHDDALDCMARILDPVLGAIFPDIIPKYGLVPRTNTCQTEYDMYDY